ncbi:MAG: hypothetical protein V1784_07830 [bacterium]
MKAALAMKLCAKWEILGVLLSFLLIASSFVGCAESDKDEVEGETWERFHVLDFGQRPMPPPDGQMLAFASEETANHTAGIYLLKQDSVIQLTAGVPPHSWDYVWSPDGQALAFSAPGQPGTEMAGIWMIDVETRDLQQLWDRGSAPSWDPEDSNVLFCAGPEDGTENEGIFRISLNPPTRIRLREQGKSPRISPDREWLAFQVAQSGLQTHALFVISMDSLEGEPIAFSVGDFCWVSDSRRIAYEFVESGHLDLFIASVSAPHLLTLLISQASMPAAFVEENRIAFVKLSGDGLDGIWTTNTEGGSARSLSATGVRPQPTSDGRAIFFDDVDGIYVLRSLL